VESAVSLLHGQVLFVAGMFVGRVLGAPDADRRLPRLLGAAIVFGALTVAAWALADGPQQVYRGYLSREFRSANHVLYFAVSGTCAAAMMLGLCALARPSARGGFRRWPLRVPSHHPILVYALGHVVLNLCPPELRLPPLAATVAWIAFPLAVAAAIALPQHMARGRDD
jgi:hypothetical protein